MLQPTRPNSCANQEQRELRNSTKFALWLLGKSWNQPQLHANLQFMYYAQQIVATKIIKTVFVKPKSYSCIVLHVLLWFHGLSSRRAEREEKFFIFIVQIPFSSNYPIFYSCTLINGQTLLCSPPLPLFVHFPSVMLVKLLAIFHVSTHRNIFRRRFLAFQREQLFCSWIRVTCSSWKVFFRPLLLAPKHED